MRDSGNVFTRQSLTIGSVRGASCVYVLNHAFDELRIVIDKAEEGIAALA